MRVWVWAVMGWSLGVGMAYCQEAPGPSGDLADQGFAEYEDVALELEDAGNPMTRTEMLEILAAGPRVGHGQILWRKSWRDGQGFPGTVRVDRHSGPIQFKLRKSRTGVRSDPWRFSLRRATDHTALVAGGVGLVHGFGLLAGKPGRTSSPAADKTLRMPRSGLRLWPYPQTGSAVMGAGGYVFAQGVMLEAQVGNYPSRTTGQEARCQMVRLSREDSAGDRGLALLAASNDQGQGVSVAMHGQENVLAWASEIAWGRHDEDGGADFAEMMWLRVLLGKLVQVELVTGWGNGGPPTSQSTRPGVMVGWHGKGGALRASVHTARGNTLKILVAGSDAKDPTTADENRKEILDIQWEWSPTPGWRCRLRRRRETRNQLAWSDRYPWLPPEPSVPEVVATTVISIIKKYDGGRVQVDFRSREAWGSDEGLGRYLITGKAAWSVGSGWNMRGDWGQAWGGGGDLVSALSPMKGYVVPRHWGHWQEQWMVGVGREFKAWQIQAGMAERDPVSLPSFDPRSIEGWCEVSWTW